jgi:hypothetical protein
LECTISGHGLDLSNKGYGFVENYCEHGNGPLGSTKDEEFCDQLFDCEVSKEGFCSLELVNDYFKAQQFLNEWALYDMWHAY